MLQSVSNPDAQSICQRLSYKVNVLYVYIKSNSFTFSSGVKKILDDGAVVME